MGEGGRLAELSPLIVAVTFLGSFLILAIMIPPELIAASEYEGYRQVSVPDYFEAIDVQSFAETWVYTMNETGGETYGELYFIGAIDGGDGDDLFGGHWLNLFYTRGNYSGKFITFRHLWTDWAIFLRWHPMQWLSEGRDRTEQIGEFSGITIENIEADIDNGVVEYTVKCSHFSMRGFIGYNTTIYSSVEDAWDHHGLSLMLGVDWDQTDTRMNVWNLIAMILFFQMPDIHWSVNALIALPLWASFAYLIFVFVSKLIPFT